MCWIMSEKPFSGLHEEEMTVPSITAITCWSGLTASVTP